MAYVLLDNSGKVIQKQPYAQEGFIEAPDFVVCGWELRNDAWHKPEPSAEQVAAKERRENQARLDYLDVAIARWMSEIDIKVKLGLVKADADLPSKLVGFFNEREALRQKLFGSE